MVEQDNSKKIHNSRFVLEFPENLKLPSWTVESMTKPKYSSFRWEPMRVVFIDPVEASTSKSLFKLIDYCKEFDKTRNSQNKTVFEMKLNILDKEGNIIEKWEIGFGSINNIDFGMLDNSHNILNSSIQTPTLEFSPTYCNYLD